MNLDILAIAAHPGDAEAYCGGTLLRMAEGGYRAGILDLTTDLTGGDRAAEAQAAAACLKLAWRDNQHMPFARLENSLPARMTVAVRIRELKPRVLILPHWESPDPDQVHGCALAAEACSLAALPELEEYSEPHRPEHILYASLFAPARPTLVVDISDRYERRAPALAAWSADAARIEALARYHGASICVRYGEPFVRKEPLAVGDLLKLSAL